MGFDTQFNKLGDVVDNTISDMNLTRCVTKQKDEEFKNELRELEKFNCTFFKNLSRYIKPLCREVIKGYNIVKYDVGFVNNCNLDFRIRIQRNRVEFEFSIARTRAFRNYACPVGVMVGGLCSKPKYVYRYGNTSEVIDIQNLIANHQQDIIDSVTEYISNQKI